MTHDQGLLAARASYMVPSLTIVIAMVLHGLAGPRAVPFFISEADYTGLDGLVFTVGLTLGGIVQMAYAWHLYHTLEAQRPRLWFVATLIGLLASFNSILVSHFDMYHHINPHILTAMLAFGGGVVWALLANIALGHQATAEGRRLRLIGFAMAALGFVVMVVSFETAANSVDPTGMTTVEFLNQAQDGIRIAAPAEYVLVAGLMTCLASFRHELLEAKALSPTSDA
ncbi:MAG: hypothetical protein QF880_03300 [Candidatus Poseidonia sp.]|nr:hypothetical protein [Poseidonia sp.]